MNEIRLVKLTIDNFKGCSHLDLLLGGKSAALFGDNASGKTTVYDALTWLLFGKDSHGQSSFDIKPLDEKGAVRDHGSVTSIEAVLSGNSGEVSLRKTYYEKWSTKRGSAEETYDGNTSDYFVDGVPSKKYEFERRVGELVAEDVFRLLTGVTYFCADMDWRDRRKVLFDVCSVASDLEIMEQDARFAPLMDAAGHLSLDDYKKKVQAERKGLCGVREDVPTRLDECRKTVEELQDIDFKTLRAERDARAAKKDQLAAELLKLDHSTLQDAKRNECEAIRNQLHKLENDNAAFRNGQIVPKGDDGSGLQAEMNALKRGVVRSTEEKSSADHEIARCEEEIAACRSQWGEVNDSAFDGAACPTCGQALTGDLLGRAMEQFEMGKKAQLRDIVEDSNRFKERKAQAGRRREAAIGEVVAAENRVAELADLLAAIKPAVQPEIKDMPGYPEEKAALDASLGALEDEVAKLSGESASIKVETRGKINALAEEIQAIEGAIAKESVLEFTRERINKLRQDAQAAAEQISKLDQTLFLMEEFTRFKVQFVENSINSRFQMASFKLFVEQVNGGLADCCEATYGGIPYQSLNNGARINVGMDVIRTLSEHYGVKVPLFVDNAESVTKLCDLGSQVIRLVVSEGDKKLRCEYGS